MGEWEGARGEMVLWLVFISQKTGSEKDLNKGELCVFCL